ncbi:beta strand repeat-containing protein [Turneriella parva]|uniref:GH29D-like beta-sandwich domain-containing protein n=1 Tax=Turneriella parva (strain ATCC BAA-1111 / DSM 21527 / NCTC 11395 / H) TaxID=869212 RepID=I4B6D0_TURPD|nr:chitobiase/beta-hexosaminidase C-terminal domain-containing protein [Turneriella parva]AFM12837.1 hypothetical protein Turpa_2192 [Turneriella parva DSM 21527]
MRRFSIFLIAGFFFFYCKKSGNDASSLGDTASGAAAYQTSAQIGAAGGTISDPNGQWTFTVPAGALSETKTITVTTNATPVGSVPQEFAASASLLKLEPSGLTFLTPATLKVTYPQGEMSEGGIEEKSQKQYYINDDSTVTAMATTLNTTTNEITAQVPHFTITGTLKTNITRVNSGSITRPSRVRRIANNLITYFNNLGSDAARNAEFQMAANNPMLLAFLNKLVQILGSDIFTAAFPNADFDGDGTVNSADPIVAVNGANVTLVSSGSLFVSTNPGAINSTQFVWRSSATGTYSIGLNGTNCSDGTQLASGAVTQNVDNTYTPINASALIDGDNEFRVCVTTTPGPITRFLMVEIARDEVLPVSSASPAGGTYSTAQNVSMSCLDTGAAECAQIAFTTNGSDPTFDAAGNVTNGTLVTEMWMTPATGNTTLKVRSRDEAGNIGTTTSFFFSVPAPTYTVGGVVSGLNGTVVLQNNGGDNLTLTTNSSFTFATVLTSGSAYNVTVSTQPSDQVCTVASAGGTVAAANISSVTVSCATSYTVGGSVTGLTGTLVLQNNGGENRTLTADGSFTFAASLASGSAYDVTALTNPASQVCSVANNGGAIASANVTNITVQCASDTAWVQDAYLKASNAEAIDYFGYSVAVSGSTVVVGAYGEDSNQTTITNTDGTASANNSATNSGAAYVFKREINGDWVQDAYLKASNAEANDNFGWSVAVSGSTVIVGAFREESYQTTITNADGSASANNSASYSGAVYVFKRESSGDWVQDAYLKASNAEVGDQFGWSVAVSGSTVVVGAYGEDSNQTTITNTDGAASANNSADDSGAVYVFKRETNGDWVQEAYLKATNAGVDEQFGNSVAVSGSTVVVGARYERADQTTITNTDGSASANKSANGSGAVYVFKRESSGDWVQDAYLKASNAEVSDQFGWSVAVSGSTVVVGANGEDSNQTTITNTDGAASANNSADDSGAVYVFKRETNGDWVQDAYLKASNAEAIDYFGYSVAVSGSTIVVGAYQEDSNQTIITNTDGAASAINSATNSGAVYVFKRETNGDWMQDAYLKASNADANDNFGYSVVVSGSTIVVGAYGEASNQTTITNADGTASANNSATNSGAVYIFKAF